MTLNVNSGGIISEERARELVSTFDKKFLGEVVSSFIGSSNVESILNQENCIGLRIYNGYDLINEKISLVLVGVDENGNDLLADGIIYDELVTCPPTCPVGISLSEN
jgi:hypothetical protein